MIFPYFHKICAINFLFLLLSFSVLLLYNTHAKSVHITISATIFDFSSYICDLLTNVITPVLRCRKIQSYCADNRTIFDLRGHYRS